MPKVAPGKGRKPPPPPVYVDEPTRASSVVFGIVMVIAMIVAGAALFGGSLSKAEQGWSSAVDTASRAIGLAVESVEVVGLEHIPKVSRAVVSAAMVAEGENMFRADPHLIRRRIEETRLVANVRVYRLWPDTVMIYADAAQPSALWFGGETWTVVDSLGRLMPGARPGDHADLIKLAGTGAPEAAPTLTEALKQMPQLQSQVDVARRIAGRRWDLHLTGGAVIRLPSDERLASSLSSLARFEAEGAVLQRAIAVIDLQVAGRAFVLPASPIAKETA